MLKNNYKIKYSSAFRPLTKGIHEIWAVFKIIDRILAQKKNKKMRREIPISQIIEQLQQLPPEAKIIVDTKTEIKITGFVVQRADDKNKAKQIAEIIIPK